MSLRFEDFPPDALAFYAELAEDNSKAFFDANRERYEQAVRLPLEALLDEAFAEFGDAKVLRPHRDVRFSDDTSPYKLAAAAVTTSGCFVQLAADGLLAGAGSYDLSRDQLQRYRAAVEHDRHGPTVEAICADLREAGLELHGEELKRAPGPTAGGRRCPGTDPDHPRIALLRHRRVSCGRSWAPGRWLHTREAADRVLDAWQGTDRRRRVVCGRPLAGWLQEHVGPPQDRTRAPR